MTRLLDKDQNVSIAVMTQHIEEIKGILKDVLEQTKKTNGRVNELEKENINNKNRITSIEDFIREEKQDFKKWRNFWLERAFWILLALGFALLKATQIVNFVQ
jgi:ferritin